MQSLLTEKLLTIAQTLRQEHPEGTIGYDKKILFKFGGAMV
jgi:hypothetical protein